MNKLFNFGEYVLDGFEDDVGRLEKYRARSTGFMNLDKQVFVPSLFFLGGLPGMGKSTFAWQLAFQLAKAGENVVYCSYEMPKDALTAKMIAREMCRLYGAKSGLCISAKEIMVGAYKADAKLAERFVRTKIDMLFPACDTLSGIHCDCPIEDLVAMLTDAAKSAGDKSFVAVIDYLQLVGVKDKKVTTPREKIDYVVAQLKRFQQETNSTVIVISAFNRASSVGGIETKLSSFKESGGIEYTGETLWGLQPRGAAGMSVDKMSEFLKSKPREVELSCVKNRYGQCYTLYFEYWSAYDYFEVSTRPVEKSKPKVSAEI